MPWHTRTICFCSNSCNRVFPIHGEHSRIRHLSQTFMRRSDPSIHPVLRSWEALHQSNVHHSEFKECYRLAPCTPHDPGAFGFSSHSMTFRTCCLKISAKAITVQSELGSRLWLTWPKSSSVAPSLPSWDPVYCAMSRPATPEPELFQIVRLL